MSSVNKVILIGRLGKDPESRSMQDGRTVVNLSLATSESWKDKSSGERKEKTEWHRVVIFNEKLGEVAIKYAVKGSLVYIEGALQTRKWTNSTGHEQYSTEIVLGPFKSSFNLLSSSNQNDQDGNSTASRPATRGHATSTGSP